MYRYAMKIGGTILFPLVSITLFNVPEAFATTSSPPSPAASQSDTLYNILGDIGMLIYDSLFQWVIIFFLCWSAWEVLLSERDRARAAALPIGLLVIFLGLPYFFSTLLSVLQSIL